jgi:hypothetical protein
MQRIQNSLFCLLLLLLVACGQQPAAPASDAAASAATDTPDTPDATPQTTASATPAPAIEAAGLDVPDLRAGAAAPTAAPTPVFTAFQPTEPVRLIIEAIDLDQRLVAVGLDAQNIPIVPRHDVGWYTYSAQPGQGENVVFWGHVLRFQDAPDIPAPFARLHQVPIGSEIVVYTADGTPHRYEVAELVWATPEQVEYILPQGEERLTLVSCIGEKVLVNGATQMTHRLITIARPAS